MSANRVLAAGRELDEKVLVLVHQLAVELEEAVSHPVDVEGFLLLF